MPKHGYKKARNKQDYKTSILSIRLSPDEKTAIQQVAATKGISVSDLVRTLLPESTSTPTPPGSDKTIAAPEEIVLPGYPGTFKVPKNKKR